jgi:lactoylglutathione lyase
MNIKAEHTHIRCQDLEAAVDWYERVLKGKVLRRGEVPGMPIVRMDVGGQIISLSPKREEMTVEPCTGKPQWGIWQLAFEVDDIEQAFQEMKAQGATFKKEPFQQTSAAKVAFVEAPDGVEIELLQFT